MPTTVLPVYEEKCPRPFDAIPKLAGGLVLLGHWPAVSRAPLRFLEEAAAAGDVTRFRFAHVRGVLVNDLEIVQHVLQSPRVFAKSRNYGAMRRVLGDGLITSEGDLWTRQRKLAQPAFHHARLRKLASTMAHATGDMLQRWDAWRDGHAFDFHEEMMRLTLRIAGLTLFGSDLDADARDVGAALATALEWVAAAVEQPYRPPPWVPTRSNRAFRAALGTLDRIVLRVIAERRARDPEGTGDDLLAMLMGARDETGATMDDRQLRDEVLTMILAGHETTANALTWAAMLLAGEPEWRRRVAEEADRVLGDRVPTLEDVTKLAVADRVMMESMRLFPPVWEIEREPLADDIVAGWLLPRRTLVMIAPWTLHRHAALWTEPSRFDPDRFLPEQIARRPRYAYLPFGDGPRICIGKAFAQMESKLILSMLCRRISFELEPGARVTPWPGVSLRPAGGLPMRLRRVARARVCP